MLLSSISSPQLCKKKKSSPRLQIKYRNLGLVIFTQNYNLLSKFIMLFNKKYITKIFVTILLRLFAHYTKSGLSSNEWKNKFLLSLVTYTRQFHKIICYCIKFLCHNHLQNTAIQTSQELQQKLVLQVMSKTDYKKAYEHILPQLLL